LLDTAKVTELQALKNNFRRVAPHDWSRRTVFGSQQPFDVNPLACRARARKRFQTS